MERRSFIKTTTMAGVGLTFLKCSGNPKTHILTLSFDDGFRKSFYRIAEIHEHYGLKACLNIIASAHTRDFNSPNEYHSFPVGNFDDWNKLKSKGHEIMPHSWDHSNLALMQLELAKEDILKCLDFFEKHLDGYKSSEAVYNFAFNASTPEVVDFALTQVKAIRTGGWDILGNNIKANPFPSAGQPLKLGCWSFGPDNADKWVETEINEFLNSQGGWLVLNLHGLDDEGWGPVTSVFLDNLLKRLVEINKLSILPAGVVLKKYS
jgi:peptidoglycan/xylan/chitin deacetylase (PgdA/CDA1 family)